jgi:4a-hydroxytetrahydrobiopterin dehydratase
MAVSYARVTVRLMTHDAGGITDKDFELARKIEEVVMWRPGQQPGSALEGTPDDERYACVIGD